MLSYFSRIFILIVFIKESSEFCPPKCTCDMDFYVSCNNAMLDVVPIQLNPTVKYINLTKNNISDINYTFIFYNKLQVLDLSYNQLKDVGISNFEPVGTLLVLILNNNNIKTIKNKAFAGLFELSELNLRRNKITTLHQNSFFNLENLKWLDLSYNLLHDIESNYFKHTKKLEWLSLRSNHIVRFSNSFTHQNTLSIKHLDLSMNSFQNFNNSDFDSLQSLIWFNLSNNRISDGLYQLYKLTNLKILDLSNNCLQVSDLFKTIEQSSNGIFIYFLLKGNSIV